MHPRGASCRPVRAGPVLAVEKDKPAAAAAVAAVRGSLLTHARPALCRVQNTLLAAAAAAAAAAAGVQGKGFLGAARGRPGRTTPVSPETGEGPAGLAVPVAGAAAEGVCEPKAGVVEAARFPEAEDDGVLPAGASDTGAQDWRGVRPVHTTHISIEVDPVLHLLRVRTALALPVDHAELRHLHGPVTLHMVLAPGLCADATAACREVVRTLLAERHCVHVLQVGSGILFAPGTPARLLHGAHCNPHVRDFTGVEFLAEGAAAAGDAAVGGSACGPLTGSFHPGKATAFALKWAVKRAVRGLVCVVCPDGGPGPGDDGEGEEGISTWAGEVVDAVALAPHVDWALLQVGAATVSEDGGAGPASASLLECVAPSLVASGGTVTRGPASGVPAGVQAAVNRHVSTRPVMLALPSVLLPTMPTSHGAGGVDGCGLWVTCAMDPDMDLASLTTQGAFDIAMLHGVGTVQVQAPGRAGEPAAFVCLRGVGCADSQVVIRLPAPTVACPALPLPAGVFCLAQVGQVPALMVGGIRADLQPCVPVAVAAGKGPWVGGLVARNVAAHAAVAAATGRWERCALLCRAFGSKAHEHLAMMKTKSAARLLQDVGDLMGTAACAASLADQ